MRLTVDLSDEDLAFIDQRSRSQRSSRSVVIQDAVRQLRFAELGDAYESAWNEWVDNGDAEAWGDVGGEQRRAHHRVEDVARPNSSRSSDEVTDLLDQ